MEKWGRNVELVKFTLIDRTNIFGGDNDDDMELHLSLYGNISN